MILAAAGIEAYMPSGIAPSLVRGVRTGAPFASVAEPPAVIETQTADTAATASPPAKSKSDTRYAKSKESAPKPARAGVPLASASEQALVALIASKQAVIETHNKDVDATMNFLQTTLREKEVRKVEDLPGGDKAILDGTLPGDWGWDPLRLAESKTHLLVYAEAEQKHGRLAMLACAGWVGSELLNGPIAAVTGGSSMLTSEGLAPSVLNGGLGQFGGSIWLFAFVLAASVESASVSRQFEGWQSAEKPWTYKPGELGFDPLSLSQTLAEKWADKAEADMNMSGNMSPAERMDTIGNAKHNIAGAEVAHGRVAMLAITAFALQEFVGHTPVVDQVPIFFATPFYRLLGDIIEGLRGLF